MAKPKKYRCKECTKEYGEYNFYKGKSAFYNEGGTTVIPICKQCVDDMIDYDDLDTVFAFLRRIDKPFISKLWMKDEMTIGKYLAKLNMRQYNNLNYGDSDCHNADEYIVLYNQQRFNIVETLGEVIDSSIDSSMTRETMTRGQELIARWGDKYTDAEYFQLEDYYQKTCAVNEVNTVAMEANVIMISKMYVRMNQLLQKEEYGDFQKVAQIYNKMVDDTGLKPKDSKSSAENAGLMSFSQVWENCEREGWIPPKKVEVPYDVIDVEMTAYLNFILRLTNRQTVEHIPEDVKEDMANMMGITVEDLEDLGSCLREDDDVNEL